MARFTTLSRFGAAIATAGLLLAGCAEPLDTIPGAELASWQAAGYAPSSAEAVEHRLSDLEPILGRGKLGRPLPSFAGVHVAMDVGADGAVTRARVVDYPMYQEPPPKHGAAQALAQARALRFEPFVRDGRPAPARVTVLFPLVETRVPPPPSRSFPQGDLSSARIELVRTGCYGTCPAYRVSISGSGEVLWDGVGNVAKVGEARGQVDPEVVAALLERARAIGFFDLRDVYRANITDGPTYEVSVTIGGKTKRVEDYMGAHAGMPYAVTSFEQAVDRAARTAVWIGPDRPR